MVEKMTPAQISDAKRQMQLHVGLLIAQGMKPAEAQVQAWKAGPAGLKLLLEPLMKKPN